MLLLSVHTVVKHEHHRSRRILHSFQFARWLNIFYLTSARHKSVQPGRVPEQRSHECRWELVDELLLPVEQND